MKGSEAERLAQCAECHSRAHNPVRTGIELLAGATHAGAGLLLTVGGDAVKLPGAEDVAEGHEIVKSTAFVFGDDGDVPNNPLPLIVYHGAVAAAAGDAAAAFEDLFRRNGWGGGWRNGIYPFHHYHSNVHEVLGIAAGHATVRFGGEAGRTLDVAAGDAVLIPAGVGHKRLAASDDLLVVGAYPGGERADLMREGAEDRAGIRRRVAAATRPGRDPVAGDGGPMSAHWDAIRPG